MGYKLPILLSGIVTSLLRDLAVVFPYQDEHNLRLIHLGRPSCFPSAYEPVW